MRIEVICQKCDCIVWIRGHYESDTNATVLNDNDSRWSDACEHIQAGDYDLGSDDSSDEDEPIESYETTDHGDSVWPK